MYSMYTNIMYWYVYFKCQCLQEKLKYTAPANSCLLANKDAALLMSKAADIHMLEKP